MARARKVLPEISDAHWDEIARLYRRGMHWRYDSVACARRIVVEIQALYTDLDAGVLVALDEGDEPESTPAGLIVCVGETTHVLPLVFRKHLVRVNGRAVYVSHDEGPLHLARAIVAEVAKALGSKRTTRESV